MLECLEGHKADQTYEYEYAQDADPGHSCRIVGDLLLVKRKARQPAKGFRTRSGSFPSETLLYEVQVFQLADCLPVKP